MPFAARWIGAVMDFQGFGWITKPAPPAVAFDGGGAQQPPWARWNVLFVCQGSGGSAEASLSPAMPNPTAPGPARPCQSAPRPTEPQPAGPGLAL